LFLAGPANADHGPAGGNQLKREIKKKTMGKKRKKVLPQVPL